MHYIIHKKHILSIVFDEKYPIIAYIILDLELKYHPNCIYYPRFEESTKYFQTW